MILNKSYLGLLLIFLQTLVANGSSGGRISEVPVRAYWKKILDHDNHNSAPVQRSTKIIKGMKTVHNLEEYLETTHGIGVEFPKLTLEFPPFFKILSIGATYSFERKSHSLSMSQREIYKSTEYSITFVIPPRTRLTRWQLIADVGGHEVDCQRFLDLVNDEGPPEVTSTAKIQERKRIIYEDPKNKSETLTKFLIKHKETKKFLTVIERKDWPAATLGYASRFVFSLYYDDLGGFKIRTWDTMYETYDILYSSRQGGIYFDQRDDNPKQLWFPKVAGKDRELKLGDDLFDGDVVTFRNVHFSDSFLCRQKGPATDVYCIQHRPDEWILQAY